ncbi:MAG: hypothetical protein MJZ30_11530 [Paludibacteraceae bacterium]|nr:hypothetical protein [Paludibacteraceae bacterium]
MMFTGNLGFTCSVSWMKKLKCRVATKTWFLHPADAAGEASNFELTKLVIAHFRRIEPCTALSVRMDC